MEQQIVLNVAGTDILGNKKGYNNELLFKLWSRIGRSCQILP